MRALSAPNPIAATIPTRRHTRQITHTHRHLRSPIIIDRVLVDMVILIPQPERGLGHGSLAFAGDACIETVVEVDWVCEERLEVEADGCLGEGVDAAVIPEGAELGRAALQQS